MGYCSPKEAYDCVKLSSKIKVLHSDDAIKSIFSFDEHILWGKAELTTSREKPGSPRNSSQNGTQGTQQGITRSYNKANCDGIRERHRKDRVFGRARIFEARDLRTSEIKVIKIIQKTKLPASTGGGKLWRRLCERLLLITSWHPGLMLMTDIFETPSSFYLVSERLEGGELFDFLLHERAVPEEICKYILKQILHGIDFLHCHALLHRDVKPENLMFRRARPITGSAGNHSLQIEGAFQHVFEDNCEIPPSLASTAASFPKLSVEINSAQMTQSGKEASPASGEAQVGYGAKSKEKQQPVLLMGKEASPRGAEESSGRALYDSHSVMTSLECSDKMSLEALCYQFELALIDFDTCKMTDVLNAEYREVANGRRRLVGTYGYLAPEVLRGHEYTRLSDLWSIGVILYILMTGIPPVPMDLMTSAKASLDVLERMSRTGIDFEVPPFSEFPAARDLCQKLLEFDPSKRIQSAQCALLHPWLHPAAGNAIPLKIEICPITIRRGCLSPGLRINGDNQGCIPASRVCQWTWMQVQQRRHRYCCSTLPSPYWAQHSKAEREAIASHLSTFRKNKRDITACSCHICNSGRFRTAGTSEGIMCENSAHDRNPSPLSRLRHVPVPPTTVSDPDSFPDFLATAPARCSSTHPM